MKSFLQNPKAMRIVAIIAFFATCLLLVYFDRGNGRTVERATAVREWTIQSNHRKNAGADSYLSVSSSASNADVGLYKTDDKSGRQRWVMTSVSGGHTLTVAGGRSAPLYLSATKDGSKIYLAQKDDGSGLQRWTVKKISGNSFEVSILGGKGLADPNSKYLYIDGKTGKLRLSPLLASNSADRNRQLWTFLEPGKTAATSAPAVATSAPTKAPTTSAPASSSSQKIWTVQNDNRRASGASSYIAAGSSGTNLGLYGKDDGTGRQRWIMTSTSGGHTLTVAGGRGAPLYMSATKDGSSIYLAQKDDGSGLQRWTVKKISGNSFEVSILGGKGLANPNAKYLYVDGSTGKLRLSTLMASNSADRSRQLWTFLEVGKSAPAASPATAAPTAAPTKAPSLPVRTVQNQYREGGGGDSFMSGDANSANTAVTLRKTDDKSGLQRWSLENLGDGSTRVYVYGGRSGAKILSASRDGTKVFLANSDDGSGLQRWELKNLYGRTFQINLFGGKGLATPANNALTFDPNKGMHLSAPLPVSNAYQDKQLWTVLQTGTTAPPETDSPQGCPPWAHGRTEDYVKDRVEMLKDRAKQQFTVCQFGDSITHRLDYMTDLMEFMKNDYLPYVGITAAQFGNFGVSGDTVQTLMHRLCNGGCPSGAKVVVFHIGTNNMRCGGNGNTPQQIARKAFKCIDFVRRHNPNARVVIASIFNREMYPDKRKETNAEIARIIAARNDPMISYTTAGEALTMNNTHNNDLLHPNAAGWRQVFYAGFGDTVKRALQLANSQK